MTSNRTCPGHAVARWPALAVAFLACLLSLMTVGAQDLDRWQWLEAPREAAALAWASDHTATASKALQALPLYATLRDELAVKLRLAQSAKGSTLTLRGPKALRLERDPNNPLGLLQTAQRDSRGVPGSWTSVLDVDAFAKAEGRGWQLQWSGEGCLPPDYNRCLLRFSDQGSDEVSVREFDLASGRFVVGGFSTPVSRTQAVWIDADHVLITHTIGDSPRTAAGWGAAARLWTRGQPLSQARVVYTAPATDAIVSLASAGPSHATRGIITRSLDYSTFQILTVDATGRVDELPIPAKLKPHALQATNEHYLFVQLAEPTRIGATVVAAETIVAYDLRASSDSPAALEVVYTPKPGEVVPRWPGSGTATRTQVVFPITRGLHASLAVARRSTAGWSVQPLMDAKQGCDVRAVAGDPAGDDVVVEEVGFIQPPTYSIHRPGARAIHLATDPAVFDASRLTVETREATSRDGTRVSYWIVRPRTPEWPGATPTLMTGYGAFGTSFSPSYADAMVGGPTMAVWFERGGALVVPAIRGGGENGEAWHRAAMRERRMASYEDFIAVAESLVKSGFTRPERLGVFGMSNGGLLSTTVATQRPNLFGAVISDVPLTDMLRFTTMGMGAAWTDEYGNPEDPALRRVLLGYSPFHNVKAGVKYPPFFVTVSTADNRVGPGHARKLAARLEEVGAEVYFFEESQGGHGVSDALKHPELMTRRLAFLVSKLMPMSR
jgi:prolyl oligopeptidase